MYVGQDFAIHNHRRGTPFSADVLTYAYIYIYISNALWLQVRFEKMPPKGHVAALLRFFPTTHGRSRIRNNASVYVTHTGRVVPAAIINEPEDEAPPAVHLKVSNKFC